MPSVPSGEAVIAPGLGLRVSAWFGSAVDRPQLTISASSCGTPWPWLCLAPRPLAVGFASATLSAHRVPPSAHLTPVSLSEYALTFSGGILGTPGSIVVVVRL